jgi:hypothetical protein
MSYKNSLVEARTLLDKIRSGEYHRSQTEKVEAASQSLVRKPKKETQEAETAGPFDEVMVSYMDLFRSKKSPAVEDGIDTRTVETLEVTRPTSRQDAGFEPIPGTLDDLSAAREAIAAVESRGSGDYAAVGPVVEKGMYKGQRAYGRYQVMEGNIGPWTKEVFGEPMTKEEFMNSPEAQDAVVENQLRKSFEKFGTYDDAASVWFSGQPYDPSSKRSDGFTTVPDYIKKFRRFFVENKGTS